jgi:hypothetical protein
LRIIEVKFLDTSRFEKKALESILSDRYISNRRYELASLKLLLEVQLPSVEEEVKSNRDRDPVSMPYNLDDDHSKLPTLYTRQLYSARHSGTAENPYHTRTGVINRPVSFGIEHNIAYWAQNVQDWEDTSPYCAPLVTVVEYRELDQEIQGFSRRFTYKIGRWTSGVSSWI